MQRRIRTTLIALGLLLGFALSGLGGHVEVTAAPNAEQLTGGSYALANAWAMTGSLNDAHQAATLLLNGKVLVSGGLIFNGNSFIALRSAAELFDPATGIWTPTGSLFYERSGHRATLLPNGRVLVAGGRGWSGYLDSAELYDPPSGNWYGDSTRGIVARTSIAF